MIERDGPALSTEVDNEYPEPGFTDNRNTDNAPRIAHVISVSEMMLRVNGKYVDEIGNPSYQPLDNRFEYDAEGAFAINSRSAETALLVEPQEVAIRVPGGDHGHVSVDRLFPAGSGELSDNEYFGRMAEVADHSRQRIWAMRETLGTFGVEVTDDSMDRIVSKLLNSGEVGVPYPYTPEELLTAMADHVRDELSWHEDGEEVVGALDETLDSLKALGVMDADPEVSKRSSVGYFNLFGRLKGYDMSSVEAVSEALGEFPYLNQLTEEYNRSADARFGDTLLAAMAEQARDQEDSSY